MPTSVELENGSAKSTVTDMIPCFKTCIKYAEENFSCSDLVKNEFFPILYHIIRTFLKVVSIFYFPFLFFFFFWFSLNSGFGSSIWCKTYYHYSRCNIYSLFIAMCSDMALWNLLKFLHGVEFYNFHNAYNLLPSHQKTLKRFGM